MTNSRSAYAPKIHPQAKYYNQQQPTGIDFGEVARREWAEAGLMAPDLNELREYRLQRVRDELRKAEYAGILLYDPVNIRYAVDSSNMQVWCLHNAARYCFIATEGPVVLFDYHGCEKISQELELIDEFRPPISWYYFHVGKTYPEVASRWAADLAALVIQHGCGNSRLAVDHMDHIGADLLREHGISLQSGQEIMEDARAIKSKAEIEAMRCAIFACERSMQVMHERLEPGMSEQELWSHLHQQIIIRGGEWLETRLLTSGPRTNPWFQECSGRVIEAGDIVSFDTDLIGPYGYCADISRAWLCGDKKASATQKDLFARALEQIQRNTEILQVGVSFRELSETAASLPEDYISQRYSCLYHGVGLCDEYPSIKYQEDWESSGYDGVVQANMVLCVESYVGLPGGKEGVKLEEQVLVKEDGIEVLSQYPLSLYLS